MKKKLLFAYDYMMTGGTSTALLSLLQALDKDKYEIDLILYKNGGELFSEIPGYINVLDEAYKDSKISDKKRKMFVSLFNGQLIKAFYYYFKNRKNKSKNLFMTLWQATEIAHATISRKLDKEYDAVIGFIESWGAHYAVSNRVKAKKRIIWIHPDIDKSYMIAEVDKRMYKRADSIVTVSNECRDNLAKHFPKYNEKIVCIENILNVDKIRKSANEEVGFFVDNSKINIVTVCRLTYSDKGLDRVLSAIAKLKQENILSNNFVWHIVGNGADKVLMEKFIAEHELEPYINLIGKKLNPFPFEKNMDMFLLPSRYEGKPMAVTEAQVLGIPCAVTNYAAAAEQINNVVDGIIMENSEQGIYEFLKNLILGEYDINKLKENTLKKVFSNEDTLKKMEELF